MSTFSLPIFLGSKRAPQVLLKLCNREEKYFSLFVTTQALKLAIIAGAKNTKFVACSYRQSMSMLHHLITQGLYVFGKRQGGHGHSRRR